MGFPETSSDFMWLRNGPSSEADDSGIHLDGQAYCLWCGYVPSSQVLESMAYEAISAFQASRTKPVWAIYSLKPYFVLLNLDVKTDVFQ